MILELCLWVCWQHGSLKNRGERINRFSNFLANLKLALPTVLVHSEGLGEVKSSSVWTMSLNIN